MTYPILCVLGIWFLQTLLPAALRYGTNPAGAADSLKVSLGGRDQQPPMPPLGGRAQRAQVNMGEALVVFLPLALLVQMQGPQAFAVNAGWVFVVCRAVYVPAYLSGIMGIRSAVWVASVAAMVAMGSTLAL